MRGDFWDRGCCQSRTHSLSLFSVLIINLRPNQVSFGMMGRQRDMFFARNILLGIGLQLLLQGPICRHTHTHTHNDTYTLAEVGDMEDVRPTSWGDGQGFAIGDMAELGYVSEVMIVE